MLDVFPLKYIDPSGHDPAPLCRAAPSSCDGWTSSSSPSATTTSLGPVFYGLPIDGSTWNNGFGANWFAESYADPRSDDYNKIMPPQYTKSSGIHPGVDHAAPAGTTVYSNVYGEVQGNLYPGDEWPNVVIKIDGYDNVQTVYSNTLSSVAPGTHVSPGDPIGTLADLGDNSHLHHSLRIGDRTYNPLDYYVDPSDYASLTWTGYADGENLYSMSSFLYSSEHNWWLDGDTAVGVTRPQ
ncbi:MAG: M23 family metallopeptidase [Ardenticatenaceae bacterium]|nr:M23 family metallopeptidase [Ardenticatenaceae bacterium]